MRIVITGAAGHIGSYVIRKLASSFPGCEIVMIDNMATQRYCSLFNLPNSVHYRFYDLDVIEADLIPIFDNCDVVIHLAAITEASASYDMREKVEKHNFQATKVVSEACVQTKAKLIFLSTASIYGTDKNQVDEYCSSREINPQSPYAETKFKEENFVKELCQRKNLKAVICRLGTIYGVSPGMRFHTAVNKFCWQAVMGVPITVWTTAFEQKRPYLDLTDVVKAFEFIINNDLFNNEVFNILTENSTVKEIITTIEKYVPELEIKFVDNKIMNELSYDVLNMRFKKLGFNFSGNLDMAVKETINLLRCSNSENLN